MHGHNGNFKVFEVKENEIVDRARVKEIMDATDNAGIAIAFLNPNSVIYHQEIGIDRNTSSTVNADTQFKVASLSKPVFAYLVLKLIEVNKTNNAELKLGKFYLPEGIAKFDLDTPLIEIMPELSAYKDRKAASALTPRIILSHLTGIPHSHESGPPEFMFQPGAAYEYNGLPYFYLQIVIEKLTKSNLQDLAQLYIFSRAKMEHSTFLRPGFSAVDLKRNECELSDVFNIDINKYPTISANSLTTTATDYLQFIHLWLSDKSLENAFASNHTMMQDGWARNVGVAEGVLSKLAPGLGWALQKNDDGEIDKAFHWGDMGNDIEDWRANIAIDLKNKTAIVYFANSKNGHVLEHHIISPNVALNEGIEYIRDKLGFAVRYESNWEAQQKARFEAIGEYLKTRQHQPSSTSLENKDLSDYQMIKSASGEGSNTSKLLRTSQSTTASLMAGSLKHKPAYAPNEKTPNALPDITSQKPAANTIKQGPGVSAEVTTLPKLPMLKPPGFPKK
jgi:CubicO group peptidase (beta-lactamase class C family)